MMRSLSSGVAGLRTHQTKMDVIGNNIANVNTYGFKASRVTFADTFYQTINGASAGSAQVQGGTNPTQIGYGSSVATIDVMNTISNSSSTDRAMDVFIAGDGFLICKDVSGKTTYTRLGNLAFDSAGNLVDGNGKLIQGAKLDDNRNPIVNPNGTITDMDNIHCDPEILDKLTGISISNTGEIIGVMPGDKTLSIGTIPKFIDKGSMSIPAASNYSGPVKLKIGALPSAPGLSGVAELTVAGFKVDSVDFGDIGLPESGSSISYAMSYDATTKKLTLKINDLDNPANSLTYEGNIKEDGTVALKSSSNSKTAMTLKVNMTTPPSSFNALATSPTLAAVFTGLKYQVETKDDGGNVVKLPENAATNNAPAPLPVGPRISLQNIGGLEINIDISDPSFNPFVGTIATATPGDDVMYNIGCLALAKFGNPGGMKESGSSYFSETSNSGGPTIVRPGIAGTGELAAGNLEMSNVDLSNEFSSMITTQRGFQANSRIITVSDTMLEELVNLKR